MAMSWKKPKAAPYRMAKTLMLLVTILDNHKYILYNHSSVNSRHCHWVFKEH